jgi:DNA replication protein DnaD
VANKTRLSDVLAAIHKHTNYGSSPSDRELVEDWLQEERGSSDPFERNDDETPEDESKETPEDKGKETPEDKGKDKPATGANARRNS